MEARRYESGEKQVFKEAKVYFESLKALAANYVENLNPGYMLTEAIRQAVEETAKHRSSWDETFPQDNKGQELLCIYLVERIENQLRCAKEQYVKAAKQNGASWADIAQVTGTTRQAAQQKYGK